MRGCSSCKEQKALTEFYFANKAKGTRMYICKECSKAKVKVYYQTHPEFRARRMRDKRRWERENPKKNKVHSRSNHLMQKYGITTDDFNRMVTNQGGKCLFCKTDEPGERWGQWHVDHCHRTGRVRAILCGSCNRKVGCFERLVEMIGLSSLLAYTDIPPIQLVNRSA